MEQEKLAQEKAEKEKAEKEKKIKEGYSFDDSNQQWQKDKDAISSMAKASEEREIAKPDSAEKSESSGKPKPANDEDDLRKKQP